MKLASLEVTVHAIDPHLCSGPSHRSGSCGRGRDIFWFLQNRRARKTGIWSWVIKWAWWSRKLINLQECFMHLLAISTSFICVIEIDSYGLKYPHWWYWWVTCNFSGCTSVAGGWKLNRSSWAFAFFGPGVREAIFCQNRWIFTHCVNGPWPPPPSVLHDHVAIFSTWMLKSA